jgi:hypothetical protein
MRSRRAVVILEIVVATTLLAVIVGVSLQMFAAVRMARRESERRLVAIQETANVVERIAALPWSELDAQRLAEIKISPSVQEMLPDARLTVTLEPLATVPAARRVSVQISWAGPSGTEPIPTRIDYWIHAPAPRGAP